MRWRLAAAVVLRLVAALCIGLAAVALVVAAASAVLSLLGEVDPPPVVGLAVWLGLAAGLLALARLAHLAVGLFVDRSKPDH
jgi:hypothetical protein